jgi:hypothetical protein
MVEKKLRKELDDIVQELKKLKEELGCRFGELKKILKPAAVVLVGLIGLKIIFSVLRAVLSTLWKHKLFIGAILIAGSLGYSKIRSKDQQTR